MTETKRPLKVFLCHAHADRDAVKALYTRLTADGVDAWLDKEKLLPGQDWELEIRKAVREADVVVVCLSKQFNQAGFRQKEVRIALETAMEQLEGEIFIIPARLEECDVPERLQRYHWVDLFDANGYEKLMQSIKLRDNQLEKARIEKEEAVKRRLPFFQTLDTRHNEGQRSVRYSRENVPLHESVISDAVRKPVHKKSKANQRMKAEYIVAIIGAVATIVAGLLSSPLIEKWFSPVTTPLITATLTEIPRQTDTMTPIVTPLPTQITDPKGVTMRLVPGDEFTMGSENGGWDEKPVHKVYLNAFYMDTYEVTNIAFKACETAGVCDPPKQTRSYTRSSYYSNSQYGDYPVIYVDWNQAQTYCEWRGASLPTEAQWEKAARGTDGRTYPWGEGISCIQANYRDGSIFCIGDTTEVGSYESGKSLYGLYDMAGNVEEWVADWYDSSYYKNALSSNPLGPISGEYHVLRGGSFLHLVQYVRSASRNVNPNSNFDIGFRCAKDAP